MPRALQERMCCPAVGCGVIRWPPAGSHFGAGLSCRELFCPRTCTSWEYYSPEKHNQEERYISFFSVLMGRCPLMLRRAVCFTHSTNSYTNLIPKHSHIYTPKSCLAKHLGMPCPSQVNTKLPIIPGPAASCAWVRQRCKALPST